MKQTNIGGRGNCMAACWASILECSIDDAPDYRAIEKAGLNWMNAVNTWLSKHHGRVYVELEPYVTDVVMPIGWHLINYGSRNSGHSVVGFCGRPSWNPMGGALPGPTVAPYNVGVLVELDDDLAATWRPSWAACLCPKCIRGGA